MSIVIWYACTLILGFIGFTFTQRVISFPDRGYALARVFGLILVSYFFGSVPDFVAMWLLIGILTALCFFLNFKFIKILDKSTIKLFVFEEILFIALFASMLLFRASNPMIKDIEKFMDFGIINGLVRDSTFPPEDIWYSGNSINYYYFGHFCIATLFKLTQIPGGIAYNIAVSYILAISGVAGFSVIFALTKNYFYSFMGTLILIAGGNLDFFYNKVILHKADYFYAQARSLIPNTINEFPAFSFLIGDLHAHILDIPNVLLFISLLISAFYTKDLLKRKLFLFCLALCLGVLGVTNSWDFIIYTPLLVLVLFFAKPQDPKNLLRAVVVIGASIILFLPFYLNFKIPSSGFLFINPDIDFPAIFKMFGLFIISILPVYFIYVFKKPLSDTDKINLLLSLCGFFLVLVPGFFVVKDIYFKLNPPYYRANTFFKFWYQAFLLLSICLPVSLKAIQDYLRLRRPLLILHTALITVLLFFVFGYTFTSVKYIVGPAYIYKGLDGTDYLKDSSLEYKDMITWLNTNVKGQPVLLEAAGRSYSLDSIVSSYTGLPTLVGWSEHELGWRGDWAPIANRMGDIEKMYESSSPDEVWDLVKTYKIKYVVLGENEKEKYGQNAGTVLKEISEIEYQSGGSQLLLINHLW